MHHFAYTGHESEVDCNVCGATYFDAETSWHCSGRTDLVHGYDTSAHSLDNCADYDETGECNHLAVSQGCDCDRCR